MVKCDLLTFLLLQLGAKRIPSQTEKLTMPNFIYNVSDLQLEAHYLWRELVNEDVIIDLIERIKVRLIRKGRDMSLTRHSGLWISLEVYKARTLLHLPSLII